MKYGFKLHISIFIQTIFILSLQSAYTSYKSVNVVTYTMRNERCIIDIQSAYKFVESRIRIYSP